MTTTSRPAALDRLAGTALGALVELADRDDPWDHDADDVRATRLVAIQERFVEHRAAIRVVGQRADAVGVDAIRSLDDLVPLLFAHTTYKSYPETFLTSGRWERLLTWLRTVSTVDLDVDVADVTNVDEWIEAVEQPGNSLSTSSGTGNKISFLVESRDDFDRAAYLHARMFNWPHPPIPFDNDRWYVHLDTRRGHHSHAGRERYFAAPGRSHGYDPIRLADVSALSALRQRIARGDSRPRDLAAYEDSVRARTEQIERRTRELVTLMGEHRREPQIASGVWSLAWRLVDAAEALGLDGGGFDARSVMQMGGGTKGEAMPVDFKERITAWFGAMRVSQVYGMIEVSAVSRMCEAGRYHPAPWMELMVLDESGSTLLPVPDDGIVIGRVAYFDCLFEGRWGGVVSGDRATVHVGDCACGRPGPSVEDTIARYSDIDGMTDDKLTCSAAVDAYIRGIVTS